MPRSRTSSEHQQEDPDMHLRERAHEVDETEARSPSSLMTMPTQAQHAAIASRFAAAFPWRETTGVRRVSGLRKTGQPRRRRAGRKSPSAS